MVGRQQWRHQLGCKYALQRGDRPRMFFSMRATLTLSRKTVLKQACQTHCFKPGRGYAFTAARDLREHLPAH